VRFYGTPAEETSQGKAYLLRAGLFNDVDAALAWHPSDETMVDLDAFQAIVAVHVDFKGRTAHAAADPWNGRSAVDAMELFTHGVNMLREHVRPTVRMHYVLQSGGVVPNVVPDSARLWLWVRDSKREGVEPVLARVKEIAQGAALMAGVTWKLTPQTGAYELLTNLTGAQALNANLTALGPIRFTEQEQSFAKAIQRSTGVPEKGLNGTLKPLPDTTKPPPGGSSDVGDVSWVVPTIHFGATTGAEGAPWHAWPVVATSGMSIGHKGMVYAAKGLATTAIDLFDDAKLLADVRAEFTRRRGDRRYVPFVPEGPPPIPSDVAR
jgi:aminobenzoyl-glutamate utilization protein B